jgi:hypothetical protein
LGAPDDGSDPRHPPAPDRAINGADGLTIESRRVLHEAGLQTGARVIVLATAERAFHILDGDDGIVVRGLESRDEIRSALRVRER